MTNLATIYARPVHKVATCISQQQSPRFPALVISIGHALYQDAVQLVRPLPQAGQLEWNDNRPYHVELKHNGRQISEDNLPFEVFAEAAAIDERLQHDTGLEAPTILVHCGEGETRSPNLALFLEGARRLRIDPQQSHFDILDGLKESHFNSPDADPDFMLKGHAAVERQMLFNIGKPLKLYREQLLASPPTPTRNRPMVPGSPPPKPSR